MPHPFAFLSLLTACNGAVDSAAGKGASNSDSALPQHSTENCNIDNENCAEGERGCRGEGSDMLPGANCQACHSGSTGERGEPATWTAAGTIFRDIDGLEGADNAIVHITDATGKTINVDSHRSGNFYTSRTLTPPLTVEIETADGTLAMKKAVDTGACNSCHRCEGEAGGKLYAP